LIFTQVVAFRRRSPTLPYQAFLAQLQVNGFVVENTFTAQIIMLPEPGTLPLIALGAGMLLCVATLRRR
jgi:hypothetical protein